MTRIVRAAVAASCLLFVPGVLEQFEAPKAAVIRILGLAAIAAWTADAEARRRFRPRPLDWAVLGWLAAELVASIFSVSPRISLLGDTHQKEGFLTALGLAGIYLAAREAAAQPGAARRTLLTAWIAIAIAGLYAVLQAFHLDPTRWAGVATYEGAGFLFRPFGTLGHPNVLGVAASAAFVSAIVPWSEEDRPALRLSLATLFALVTLITLSRGAWLAALLGAIVILVLLRLAGRDAGLGRLALRLGLICVILLGLALLAGAGPTLLHRIGEFFHPESGSARSRLEIWKIALRAWRDRPWLGQGPDAFELMFQRFQTPEYWVYEWGTLPSHAHSIYIHQLATRGVVGFVAALMGAVSLVAAALTAWRRGPDGRDQVVAWSGLVVALAVAGAFGALGIAGATLLAVAAGTLATFSEPRPEPAPVPTARRRASRGKEAPAPPRRGPLIAGVAVAIVVTLFSGLELAASRAVFEGFDWAPRQKGDGDPVRARRASDRSIALTPWDDVAYYYRSETILRLAQFDKFLPLDEAESAARRAIAIEPNRALNYQALGSVMIDRAVRSDPEGFYRARDAFAEASRLAPYNGLLWLQLADAELLLGQAADAQKLARRTLAFYPDQPIAKRLFEEAKASTGMP